jgi:hypothetical protein
LYRINDMNVRYLLWRLNDPYKSTQYIDGHLNEHSLTVNKLCYFIFNKM